MPDDVYAVWFYAPVDGYEIGNLDLTIQGADIVLDEVVLKTFLPQGTVKITGELKPGATLTAETAGWPAGTTVTYQWERQYADRGGNVPGATASTLTIEEEWIGSTFTVSVTGHKSGFASALVGTNATGRVSVAQQPAVPAPVATSAELPAYLAARGIVPISHRDTVPAAPASLDPNKAYRAYLPIESVDSFVDVYVYAATPIHLGTFPASLGLSVELSAELLTELGAGRHTLVAVGQSSGEVAAGEFYVAAMLAATGVDAVVPLWSGAGLLLLGAGALVVGRRRRATA